MPGTDPSKILIRRASADDADLLAVLGAVTFYEAYYEQDDPADLADYIVDSFSPAKIREQLNDGDSTFLLAFVDGRAVGYARLVSGETDPNIASENTIELRRIYVLERLWGKGVGEALLRQCETFARELGKESIWLGVWQQNERGLRFYAKHSFIKVGTLTFPYGDSAGINDVLEKGL